MLASAEFWVLISFLILAAMGLYWGLRPTLGMLDKRAERIRQQIHEAEELREEAQRQLAEAKRTQREAKRDAEEIVEHARTEAQRLRDRAEQDIKEQMERRERLTMQSIEQTEREAMEEVRARIAQVAVNATERLCRDNMTDKRANELVDQAIQDVGRRLTN